MVELGFFTSKLILGNVLERHTLTKSCSNESLAQN